MSAPTHDELQELPLYALLLFGDGEVDLSWDGEVYRSLVIANQNREAALERGLTPLIVELAKVCRACGCTDDRACAGGCWWAEHDLCSACR